VKLVSSEMLSAAYEVWAPSLPSASCVGRRTRAWGLAAHPCV